MNHSCNNCIYKYEAVSILDYYQKTGNIPNLDWSYPNLESSFWLCKNEKNSPIDFSSNTIHLNNCQDFNTFGNCPFYLQSNAENINPITFSIPSLPEEPIHVDDVVSLTATPAPQPEGLVQLVSFKYQWYKNGRKLFKEKKQSITIDTTKEDNSYYHCVITETMSDNGDGGKKVTTVETNSVQVVILPKEEPLP